MKATPLIEHSLGRAVDMLYEHGVPERSSLIAPTAAQYLGLTPTMAHLDSSSFHVDGRYYSAEEANTPAMRIQTRAATQST